MAATPNDDENGATHIAAFFAHYPDFEYNPTTAVRTQFRQLLRFYGWDYNSQEHKKARNRFATALGKQFSEFYGSDAHDLNAWQALCAELRVEPIPESRTQCKKIILSTHVNLVDFIDTRITGRPVKIFENVDELRRYTRNTRKIFPRESAKESGVLKLLLRRIF